MSNVTRTTATLGPAPHARDEELAAVDDVAVITIQLIAIVFELIISIPMIITLCKSYNRVYSKPAQGVEIQQDDNYDNIKKTKLLHRGIVCTLLSIITYMAAGLFIIIQELHESPWIVDHLVYIFLILSYSFIFVAVRNLGMNYFLTFINNYCDNHNINNQKRNEFQRLFKGIYNAYGVFSVIYWFGYILAIATNKNNFIVTAIGLGHIYLATITLLHGGMLQAMKNYKDEDNQSSRLLDNDQMDAGDANDNDKDNNNNKTSSMIMSSLNDLDEKEDGGINDDEEDDGGDIKPSVNINLNANQENKTVNMNQNADIINVNEEGIIGKWKAMPTVSKWVYIFVAMGSLLILEGITYAIAYDKNDGDFEFPEVHPFFLFTIFMFFAILHIWFMKYTYIKN